MSINIGNFNKYEYKNNNNFIVNSYNDSNVIILNADDTSYNDALINYKNIYVSGYKSNKYIIADNNNIYCSISPDLINFKNNNININNLIKTTNDTVIINSNIIFNSNNSFAINNKYNTPIFNIRDNYINIGLSSNIYINQNTNINSDIYINNGSLFTDTIKNNKEGGVTIHNAILEGVQVNSVIYNNYLHIINDHNYNKIPLLIKRYNNPYNIIDIYTCNINANPIRNFCIDTFGNISIGSNMPNSILYITPESQNSNIIFYDGSSNNKFIVNRNANVGIGTTIPNGLLHIERNDYYNSNNTKPLINLALNYNINSNYTSSKLINTNYYAYNGIYYEYDKDDNVINSYSTILNNYKITNLINSSLADVNTYDLNVNYWLNNNEILNNFNYNSFNYYTELPKSENNNKYVISTTLYYPPIFYIDSNSPSIPTQTITSSGRSTFYNYNYNINLISKDTYTNSRYVFNQQNFYNRIESNVAYNANNDIITVIFSINIEKGIFNYNYIDYVKTLQAPPYLLYATSNNQFSASISSTGKLNIGSTDTNNIYDLYTLGNSRIDNIECYNIKSISGKNNINFTYCNISNINKSFVSSNINKFIYSDYAIINNSIIHTLNNNFINTSNIFSSNITSSNISSARYNITNNFASFNMPIYIGNVTNNTSNSYLKVNVDSGYNNGIEITTNNNLNPSLNINTQVNNYFPNINLTSKNSTYNIRIKNDQINSTYPESFQIYNNNNYANILQHVNNYNIINIGNNSILADVSESNPRTNSNNKIAIGFPYRYLINNSYLPSNWNNYFYNNTIDSPYMLNVYGSFNFSTISNKPLIRCLVNDINTLNETFNIGIGIDPDTNLNNTLLINGDITIMSNIRCSNTIFTDNCYVYRNLNAANIGTLSDIRIKTNLNIIENSLDIINNISGYRYKRIDTKKIEIGLIAQEVNNVLPELITKDKDLLHISYGNLAGVFVECIKDLKNKVINLEKKIDEMKIKNDLI